MHLFHSLQKEILSIIHFVQSWSAFPFEKFPMKNKINQEMFLSLLTINATLNEQELFYTRKFVRNVCH